MYMKKIDLKIRTKEFTVVILKFIPKIPNKQPFFAIVNEISRSSSSVGANYRAVSRANSKADFINKLKIVEEDCDETLFFWKFYSNYFLSIILNLKISIQKQRNFVDNCSFIKNSTCK